MDCHTYSNHCGKHISDRLYKKNSIQPQHSRNKQNHRNKTNSLSAGAQKQALFCLSHHQKEERIIGVESNENEGHYAAPQSNFDMLLGYIKVSLFPPRYSRLKAVFSLLFLLCQLNASFS